MGDIKKLRKKYKTPKHPWQRERIDKEKVLKETYGLKNKKEIWKFTSKLKNFTKQAKKLLRTTSEQSKKEEKELIAKLKKYGLADDKTKVEDILNLTVENFLDKRLQTKVHRMGLSRSVGQSRQFITHGHVSISGKKMNSPSYLVKNDDIITFKESSKLNNPEHPERIQENKKEKIIENDE